MDKPLLDDDYDATAVQQLKSEPETQHLSRWQRLKKRVSMVHLILIGVIVGAAIGTLMSIFKPSKVVVSWVELPGDLFLRSLQMIVVPLIFSNMIVGMSSLTVSPAPSDVGAPSQKGQLIDMDNDESNGEDPGESSIPVEESKRTKAISNGLVIAMPTEEEEDVPAIIPPSRTKSVFQLGRALSRDTASAERGKSGKKVAGMGGRLAKSAFLFYTSTTVIAAISGILWVLVFRVGFKGIQTQAEVEELASQPKETRDVSQSIQSLFKSIVPDNVFQATLTPDILALISVAMAFGFLISKYPTEDGKPNFVFGFFCQFNELLLAGVQQIIKISPIGVLFLIAGTLASNPDFLGTLQDLGVLIACVMVGHLFHVLITIPLIYLIFVRRNPYAHMKRLLQAAMTAIGTSSSAATLPVTMQCCEEKCHMSKQTTRFVLPLGATINMDGTALYLPAAILWLATVLGLEVDIGAMIMVVATVGAMGASPIPNAGLVLILMVWDSAFPNVTVPSQVAYLLVIDWLLDRSQTAVNVLGDSVAAAVLDATIHRS